jgi:hypothetical protein
MDARAETHFGCSISIPPCGIQVPPVVGAARDGTTDAFCDCPNPCTIVYCLPPVEARAAWYPCPIDWGSA